MTESLAQVSAPGFIKSFNLCLSNNRCHINQVDFIDHIDLLFALVFYSDSLFGKDKH